MRMAADGGERPMLRYVLRRLVWTVLLFYAVTLVTFVIFSVIPVDPVANATGGSNDPDTIARVRYLLGLDQPLYVQYWRFLRALVVHHDLGYSFASRQSVNEIVGAAAPVTASVVAGGAVLWLTVAASVGALSALRPRSLAARAASALTLLGVSAHPIWVGLLLSYGLGYRLGWLPIDGYCTFLSHPGAVCGGPAEWARHLVLPWITFAALYAALYAVMIRASLLDALSQEFVLTARAKGASGLRILRAHVLRPAMLPIVTMLGMDVGTALGATVFVESVFGLPGLGHEIVGAARRRDLPVTEGAVLFLAIVVLALNLLVDLACAALDPRVRVQR